MITGTVNAEGVPAIEIDAAGRRWQAVIDTGFNGQLELPRRMQPALNPRFVGRVTSMLAANRQVEEDLFLVDFPFEGRIVQAEATFVDGDEILIGTGLLREYCLHIDFPVGTVTLERT